jgi:uncharacterized protein (TIGR00661 family)
MNWGLGHAARVVPVIHELIKHDVEVIIAADGRSLELLRKEFSELKWIHLPGYDIHYSKNKSFMKSIMLQLPMILRSFFAEKKWLQEIMRKEKINAVISDNRYGLYSKKIYTVFITHQTGIMLPRPIKCVERMLNEVNHYLIRKFNECWIPDFEGENNLSGDLSHRYLVPPNAVFIGPLSRFSWHEEKKQFDLLVLLSGPEPQRTVLEKILMKQLLILTCSVPKMNFKLLMVRGVPEGIEEMIQVEENFFLVDFLGGEKLNTIMLASDLLISRSGYSTIMDLATLAKKAILIPTPGQTEQEYLAYYFKERKIFYSEKQANFNLKRALVESEKYSGLRPHFKTERLKDVVDKMCTVLSFRI